MNKEFTIGIDLGGTRIKGAAFDLASGECLARDTLPTRAGETDGDHPAFATGVRKMIDRLEKTLPDSPAPIGIAAPGFADRDGTCIRFMPGRLNAIENFLWSGFLRRENVTVLNDAHAALFGEIWQGAAKGVADVVLLTLGTGVGGAIVSGGRLLRGRIGRAGHLGHLTVDFNGPPDICNTPGSLEDAIGNHTIEKRSRGRFTSTRDLLNAVKAGDAAAIEVWRTSVRALGAAIASIANAVDPEIVLIGGGISEAGDLLFHPLQQALDEFEWRPDDHPVTIRKATLGEWAGTYGAAQYAFTQTEGNALDASL